jgi:hypothetical protein
MRNCLMALGIVIAAATAVSAQPVYRLHDNGDLWVSTAERCGGNLCVRWHLLDNNPNTREITASDHLYQLRNDGASWTIWVYLDKPCDGGLCQGWRLLDDNPHTRQIAVGGVGLYKRHDYGAIWRYSGPRWCSGASCWQPLYDPTTWTILSTRN